MKAAKGCLIALVPSLLFWLLLALAVLAIIRAAAKAGG